MILLILVISGALLFQTASALSHITVFKRSVCFKVTLKGIFPLVVQCSEDPETQLNHNKHADRSEIRRVECLDSSKQVFKLLKVVQRLKKKNHSPLQFFHFSSPLPDLHLLSILSFPSLLIAREQWGRFPLPLGLKPLHWPSYTRPITDLTTPLPSRW